MRDYWDGLAFDDAHIFGRPVKKNSFIPIAWICRECGNVIFDEEEYSMNRAIDHKRNTITNLIQGLTYDLRRVKKDLRHYKQEYTHTNRDVEIEMKLLMHRFYRIRGEIESFGYFKGLKEGSKIAEKYHKEELEALKLSDEQILKKAKLIEAKRKLGY